jgi:hypothetical protein
MKQFLSRIDTIDRIGLGLIAVIILGTGTVFGLIRPMMLHDAARSDVPSASTAPTEHSLPADVDTPATSTSPAPSNTPATTVTPSANSSPKTAQKPSAPTQTPAPSPPVSTAFQITYVRVDGATWYCAGGAPYAIANSIVNANNTAGGTFSWQVETTTPSALSTPIPAAFPAGQAYYLGSSVDYRGPYFSGPVTAGESIRYRITGPNTIVSAWYTIPADATC